MTLALVALVFAINTAVPPFCDAQIRYELTLEMPVQAMNTGDGVVAPFAGEVMVMASLRHSRLLMVIVLRADSTSGQFVFFSTTYHEYVPGVKVVSVNVLLVVVPSCEVPFGPDTKMRNVLPAADGEVHANVMGSICEAPSAGETRTGALFEHDALTTLKLLAAESSGEQLPEKFERTRHIQLPIANVVEYARFVRFSANGAHV